MVDWLGVGGGSDTADATPPSIQVALWIRNASDLQQRGLIGETFKGKLNGVAGADKSPLERVDFEPHP